MIQVNRVTRCATVEQISQRAMRQSTDRTRQEPAAKVKPYLSILGVLRRVNLLTSLLEGHVFY